MRKELVRIRIDLDIEYELKELDGIFKLYRQLPNDLLFIKGARHPISITDRKYNISKLQALDMVSDQPYLAVYSVECITELLIKCYVDTANDRELFFKNPLIDNYHAFISKNTLVSDVSELIINYLVDKTTDYYTIDNTHIEFIIKKINHIFSKLSNMIPYGFNNNIVDFSFDGENIIFEIGDDIRSYRLEETIAYKEANSEDNNDLQYDIVSLEQLNSLSKGFNCRETSPNKLLKDIIRNRTLANNLHI